MKHAFLLLVRFSQSFRDHQFPPLLPPPPPQLRPKISTVIENLYKLAYVSPEKEEGFVGPGGAAAAAVAVLDLNGNLESASGEGQTSCDKIWRHIHKVEETPALSFGWSKSKTNENTLANLRMDPNNIVRHCTATSSLIGTSL